MEQTTNYETTNLEFAYSFHEQMRKEDLILAYEGEISQGLTKAFSNMAEESLEKENVDNRVKRQVFHVMVESLQNLSKHTDNSTTGEPMRPGAGIFLVGRCKGAFYVVSGNSVSNEKVAGLRERLDEINAKSPDEMKAYYKEKLRASRLSEKAGAGLGFIDMAKKTGSKVIYQFIELNEKTSFFLYRINISK